MLALYIVIGIIFGFFAGLMAFVISWREYEKHKFEVRRIFKESFQTAAFAFVVFLLLSILIGIILTRFIIK